jgi:hypothetical protein
VFVCVCFKTKLKRAVCACGTEASEKEMIDEDNQYKQKTTTQHKVLFHFIDYYRHLHLYMIYLYINILFSMFCF